MRILRSEIITFCLVWFIFTYFLSKMILILLFMVIYTVYSLTRAGVVPVIYLHGMRLWGPRQRPWWTRSALGHSCVYFLRVQLAAYWCRHLLRDGDTLPTHSILLGGRWPWLLTTSTGWPAWDLTNPSSTWRVSQASS